MELLFHPISLAHDTGIHPENAGRLKAFAYLPPREIPNGEPWLTLVHSQAHVDAIRRSSRDGFQLDEDTFLSQDSFAAATCAVGAAILASEEGNFALFRPPGHHAFRERASGFCLFNQVAVAAAYQVQKGKRVLIIDFDGHYGDGTADLFYTTDKVLYFSIHQHPAFPGTGYPQAIGEGKGMGFTMNMALPAGSGDDIFIDAISHFFPLFRAFNPDITAISAGFDGAAEDPLLQLQFSPRSFHAIGQRIASAFPRHFAVLEGGYDPPALERGIYAFLDGVNGKSTPEGEGGSSSNAEAWESYEKNLHSTLDHLSPIWKI